MILKHFRNAAWRAPLFLEHFPEKRHVRTRVVARLVHILQAQEIGLGFGAATELEKGQRYTEVQCLRHTQIDRIGEGCEDEGQRGVLKQDPPGRLGGPVASRYM